ncbi:hypothetical protein M885DRAFT_552210 [Pelagophyceae sp. CCMP2097]|nr:hypothetical protein M885DRAFT_552210 [Pelagophyceae sp. CCMP2097]
MLAIRAAVRRLSTRQTPGSRPPRPPTTARSHVVRPSVQKKAESLFAPTPSWESQFARLSLYRQNFGDCLVPRTWETDRTKLGKWVEGQRKKYSVGKMSALRITKLEDLGFVWDLANEDWFTNFESLMKYKAEHGDCSVPADFKAKDGQDLHAWVQDQNISYNLKTLRVDRVMQLEAVGVKWDSRADGWDKSFERLALHFLANQNCSVPFTADAANGTKLWQWLNEQRRAYQAGELSDGRVEKLNAVRFNWEHLVDWWDANCSELAGYHAAFGNCTVPHELFAADGTKLWQWVDEQRRSKNAGEMRPDRIAHLDAMAFPWVVERLVM